jgi:1,4-dihydroxy-2-naphthoyl-CoA synthase
MRDIVMAQEKYAGYTHLLFEYPAERILKITINRPEKNNALDETGHRELTYVWRNAHNLVELGKRVVKIRDEKNSHGRP